MSREKMRYAVVVHYTRDPSLFLTVGTCTVLEYAYGLVEVAKGKESVDRLYIVDRDGHAVVGAYVRQSEDQWVCEVSSSRLKLGEVALAVAEAFGLWVQTNGRGVD